MDKFLNPRTSPGATVLFGVTACSVGVFLSTTRLQTAMAESSHNQIAQQRAEVCRILPASEKIELGAYYFQPTQVNQDGGKTGSLLDEGMYICDRYGSTGRIERGGYVQHIAISNDISALNKTLEERLKDSSNPDSSRDTQVQRAINMGVYRPRPKHSENQQPNFFQLN